MKADPGSPWPCSNSACECHAHTGAADWGRRDFLKAVGLGAGALLCEPWQAMAGPFTHADFENLVPADKKLRSEWVKSLTDRGEPTVYRGAELESIGMPIGGICAGQLYLGGDGRLWHWDLFNRRIGTGSDHYANPLKPASPVDQGFALQVTLAGQTQVRALNRSHWREVSFKGEYPIGYVQYRDPDCPVAVDLEAFSPFIPLNSDDSSLPATVLEFTLRNLGKAEVEVELAGWLENAVCLYGAEHREGSRRNRLVRGKGYLLLECSAEDAPPPERPGRPDLVFEDFEAQTYGPWTATGTAFGSGPVEIQHIPPYQGDVGGAGKRVVNSHASAPGQTVEEKDAAKSTLTSRPFTLDRRFITFLIGGGNHPGKTCMNLVIDNQVVLTATGNNDNRMRPMSWDVRRWAGQAARLEILDQESGPWGNIGIDDIVLSDHPRQASGPIAEEPDFGTLGLMLIDAKPGDTGRTALPEGGAPAGIFSTPAVSTDPVRKEFGQKLAGSLTRKIKLAPRASTKATFAVVWHFPNLKLDRLPPGRHYAARFPSAHAVADYLGREFPRLSRDTRLWHDTWYESSLPHWFLERTFLNTSILATSTCYRLGSGRFYGWEGVGCCEGTCGHVWQYAHAVARLFPELERTTRQQVDFGLSLQPDGAIHFRGEFNDIPAIDAQAGTVLRALREHQISPDDAFLRATWPQIKRAVDWLITKDGNGDGLIEGNQHNTLDTDWFGPVAWLSGLYLAALLAAQTMAEELGDTDFAAKCRSILKTGRRNIVSQLFDREYFINRPDPKHLDAINSGTGCHIDQVMGQSWAFQVGLPRVFPERETMASLQSLWRYNFTPDVGPYRKAYAPGRWYAMPGEAGLLMCTFPRSDWDYAQAKGKGPDWAAGYFNECMNGFEYQVAGHMLWEGMLTEGLAITRAVHDRYHASRRNPWNEVECGDHYARSMASYGVYLAACGFQYHGPMGLIGFAPRMQTKNFRAAFTTAEGWGVFTQKAENGAFEAELEMKWGRLQIRTCRLQLPRGLEPASVSLTANGRAVPARHTLANGQLTITLATQTRIPAGGKLQVRVG